MPAMKRVALLREVSRAARRAGLQLSIVRQGDQVELWRCGSTRFAVPRHREVAESAAGGIFRDLEDGLGYHCGGPGRRAWLLPGSGLLDQPGSTSIAPSFLIPSNCPRRPFTVLLRLVAGSSLCPRMWLSELQLALSLAAFTRTYCRMRCLLAL